MTDKKPQASGASPWAGEFVNPNDVRVQHSYCLHVLASTQYAYLQMVQLLRARAHDPEVAKFLADNSKHIEGVEKLHDQLMNS